MIEVQSLSRFYGAHRAVSDVSFSIQANEVVGFLGLNGAGKSTTLKVIAGLLLPSSGTVVVDNVDMATAPVSFRSQIGFLPEDPPLHTEMTVTEFLTYLGGIRGMSGRDIAARLPVVIAACQLKGQEDRLIAELSHGFRKRVGIAQAIIHRPKLVILDEPISGLDPYQIVEMREVIRGLSSEATVLVSSHILSEISQTCDRLLVLHKGKLVATGSEEELAKRVSTSPLLEMTLISDLERLKSVLDAHDSVDDYKVVAQQDPYVKVEVQLNAEAHDDLIIAMVGAGIGVRRMVDAHGELEATFLNLTRGESA